MKKLIILLLVLITISFSQSQKEIEEINNNMALLKEAVVDVGLEFKTVGYSEGEYHICLKRKFWGKRKRLNKLYQVVLNMKNFNGRVNAYFRFFKHRF